MGPEAGTVEGGVPPAKISAGEEKMRKQSPEAAKAEKKTKKRGTSDIGDAAPSQDLISAEGKEKAKKKRANDSADAGKTTKSKGIGKKKAKKRSKKVGVGDSGDAGEASNSEGNTKTDAGQKCYARGKTGNARRRKAKARRAKQHYKAPKDQEVGASYLSAWAARKDGAADAPAWKFNKVTQTWLLRHAHSKELVPKRTFAILLRYMEGLQGSWRDRARDQSKAIVLLRGAPLEAPPEAPPPGDAPPEEAPPEVDTAIEEGIEEQKARKLRLQRARQILLALGETLDEDEEGEAEAG